MSPLFGKILTSFTDIGVDETKLNNYKFAYYMCVLFAKSDNRVKNFDERKPKQEESDLVLKLRDDIDTIYIEGTKLIQLIIEGPI